MKQKPDGRPLPESTVNDCTLALSRRQFLRIAGAVALGFPSVLAQVGCAPTILDKPSNDTGLSLGYTSGEVTPDSAMVWLRASPGSKAVLRYGKDAALAQSLSSEEFSVRPLSDNTAVVELRGLDPATTYYYRAEVAGKTPGPVASFKTAPRPNDLEMVSFCFSGDTREFYKPFTVMDAVCVQQPDFFLHLGDTIYADRGGSAYTLPEFWAKYRANRDDISTQRCFQRTSFYVVWDDHEITDNYRPDNPLAPIGRQAFLDYWPVRQQPRGPHCIYRSFRWGQALELFVIDARQYRNQQKKTMLGKEQKEWLFEGLRRSNALFKFIATSVPVAGGGDDRWDGYPRERSQLLNFIRDNKISGVVFLSADMHYAAITKIPKGHGLLDITAGPLAAPLNRITNSANRRYEYFLAQNFNFGKITVYPKSTYPHALLEFIDQDNHIFHRRQLNPEPVANQT